MRKENLERLLDSIYELEGLVHLAINRDDEPAMLPELIRRKSRELMEHAVVATEAVTAQEEVSDDVAKVQEKAVQEVSPVEAWEDELTEVMEMEAPEENVMESSSVADESTDESEEANSLSSPQSDALYVDNEAASATEKTTETVSEALAEAAPASEGNPQIREVIYRDHVIRREEIAPNAPAAPHTVAPHTPAPNTATPYQRVSETPKPESAPVKEIPTTGVRPEAAPVKEIPTTGVRPEGAPNVEKKAEAENGGYKFEPYTEPRGRLVFSINDRYRFRRELFNGSDTDFNTTLSLVASMDDYEEAADYFLDELQWDEKSPEVVDFLEILKNYFK